MSPYNLDYFKTPHGMSSDVDLLGSLLEYEPDMYVWASTDYFDHSNLELYFVQSMKIISELRKDDCSLNSFFVERICRDLRPSALALMASDSSQSPFRSPASSDCHRGPTSYGHGRLSGSKMAHDSRRSKGDIDPSGEPSSKRTYSNLGHREEKQSG